VNTSEIHSHVDDVTTLVKWWVSRSRSAQRKIKERGEVSDFINDVFARMLFDFRDNNEVDITLATATINACKWELCRYVNRAEVPLLKAERIGLIRDCVVAESLYYSDYISENAEMIEFWQSVKTCLNSRSFYCVWYRLGVSGPEVTLRKIGCHLNISKTRVQQIIRKAVMRLYHKGVLNGIVTEKHVRTKHKGEWSKLLIDELLK
jgi:hypothetical protein